MSPNGPPDFNQEKERLRLYEREVEDEPWKKDHIRAMKCRSFEELLQFGIMIYDGLIRADEVLRNEVLSGRMAHDPSVDRAIKELFQWWLRPCDKVEAGLLSLEREGFEVKFAADFRTRCKEARWILLPPEKAFDHPKMVALRDRAIDAMRANEGLRSLPE
jgi:hypothetical protein